MLFNKQLLFIHVLKTGGMSLTHFFLSRLPAPTHYITQEGHFGNYKNWNGILPVIGNRHGDLHYARNLLKQFNRTLDDFKIVISVIRDPYKSELSRFTYFARDLDWIDPQASEVLLARQGDFELFVKNAPYAYGGSSKSEIARYYTLDGKMPKNIGLLRLEKIDLDLSNVLKKNKIQLSKIRGLRYAAQIMNMKHPRRALVDFLSVMKIYKPYRLPHLNRTQKSVSIEKLMTPEAEAAIYERYKWVFDNGYYDRVTF